MAAGDIVLGTFAVVQASSAPADSVVSVGAKTTITAALTTGTEDDYPLLDFKLDITAGTVSAGATCNLYFTPSDGTDTAPDAVAGYLQQRRGTFVLKTATADEYYVFNVPNDDKNGTYSWENKDGANALTGTLYARGKKIAAS